MKIDSSQIFEKFNQLDSKVRYAIFASILLVIVLLDVFTLISFQWNSLGKIDNENQALQQNIERIKVQLQGVDHMKTGLQDSRIKLEAVNMKIRTVGDKDALLEDISRLANGGDVKIDQLLAQTESQQTLVSTDTVKYYALPIVIQASSGYHAFGRFLNRLESEKLFFTLSHFAIENRVNDMRHHNINVTLKVVLSDKNTDVLKK